MNKPLSMLKFNNEQVSVHSIKTKYQGFFKMNEYSLQHKLFSGEQSQLFTREIFERGDEVDMFPDYEDWMNVGTEYWTEMEIDNWKEIIIQSYSKRVKGFTDCEEEFHDDLINWQNSLR